MGIGLGIAMVSPQHMAQAATLAIFASLAGPPNVARALDTLSLQVAGSDAGLEESLLNASLVAAAKRDGTTQGDALLAAARADYARFVGALYAAGYFGGTVSILVDGREAASIPPISAPAQINRIDMIVRPGPAYRFAQADIAPLTFDTVLPEGFRRGAVARTGVIRDAAEAALMRWREEGHAKADVANQQITADHANESVSAAIALAPGPRLRFGNLTVQGNEGVSTRRVAKIAGLPTGEVYDPATVDRVANRLRRTGTFRSVTLTEADQPNPDGTLDFTLNVTEQLPRRFGFGAELASEEGLTLSGFWLHRNFRGGADRLRIDGEIAGIGGDTGGIDYSLGARIDRPATFGPDIDAAVYAEIEQFNEPEFTSKSTSLGIEATRRVRDDLTNGGGLRLDVSEVTDASGTETYTQLFFPIFATLDRRENVLNTNDGYYLHAELAPFLGFSDSEDGARMTFDARAYEGFGDDNSYVLAARLQAGSIFGASVTGLPNDQRFYSGGGGTVRGQDYQSLDIDLGGGLRSGGRSFLGINAEVRARVTGDISVVGFYDWGHISAGSTPGSGGESHAGAGIGLRYDTGIGPIRVDVGVPVSGTPGGPSYSLYIGIGQAF